MNKLKKIEFGIFVKCPHPEIIESIAISGFDYAVIDMEHTPIGQSQLYPLVLAAEANKLPLIVRIPQKIDAYFKWCRDLGIKRIQVPHIETVNDALFAIKNTYFAPKGERGLCRFVRAARFSEQSKDEYIEISNNENELILQIEGKNSIEQLPSIIKNISKQVSIFIGPYDLSQSMGKPGRIWDEDVIAEMLKIIKLCSENNIKVGTFTDTEKGVHFWKENGIDFIEYASDLNLFIGASRDLLENIRSGKKN